MLPPSIVCAACHRTSEGHDRYGNCVALRRSSRVDEPYFIPDPYANMADNLRRREGARRAASGDIGRLAIKFEKDTKMSMFKYGDQLDYVIGITRSGKEQRILHPVTFIGYVEADRAIVANSHDEFSNPNGESEVCVSRLRERS